MTTSRESVETTFSMVLLLSDVFGLDNVSLFLIYFLGHRHTSEYNIYILYIYVCARVFIMNVKCTDNQQGGIWSLGFDGTFTRDIDISTQTHSYMDIYISMMSSPDNYLNNHSVHLQNQFFYMCIYIYCG